MSLGLRLWRERACADLGEGNFQNGGMILIFAANIRAHLLGVSCHAAFVLAAMGPVSAYAQAAAPGAADADADANDPTDIVVTATGYDQTLEDAPASITVVDGDDLRRRSIQNLGDAVRDIEGVVVNGGANEQDIQLRGMPGDYTLILVDGKRQSGRESRVNGNRGYEQGFTPPAAAIERIEVVRGPMSSLYGSDAIGGVINVITRKPGTDWSASVSYDVSVREAGDQGDAHNAQAFLSGPLVKGLVGFQLWGGLLERAADDNVELTNGFARSRNRNASGRLYLTPSPDHDIILEGGVSRLRNGKGVSANWATRQQDNDRDYWSVTHNGKWGAASSTLSYLDEKTSREGLATPDQTDVYGRKPEIRNQVFDGKLVLPIGTNTPTVGVQWLKTSLTDWNQANRGQADEFAYETYSVTQKAIFAEDEWRISDAVAVTGGARLDDHSRYGRHFNPRVYAVWHATPRVTLKGGVAKGFKAPELRAVIPDYAVIRRNRLVQFGNPDLKPETSTNYEATAMWSNRAGIALSATVFYNDFRDRLSTETTDQTWEGLQVLNRINIDKASILGVELSGKWQINRAVSVKGNFTYLDSEQKSGANKGAPLALTPKYKANARADWDISRKARVWTSINYYGKEYEATATGGAAPAYLTADVLGSYELNAILQLKAGVYNVNNKRLDDATYGTVNYGRTYWFGLGANF